jgi:hypothetical protein
VSEHADQFEERDEERKDQGTDERQDGGSSKERTGSHDGTEQGNCESGGGPGRPDPQGQAIQDPPDATEDPSAD